LHYIIFTTEIANRRAIFRKR